MRRTIVVLLICVPVFVVFMGTKAQGSNPKERDVLVEKLNKSVLQFFEKEKKTQRLSGEDERIASGVMDSLSSDPPLKTIEERRVLADQSGVRAVFAAEHEQVFNGRIEEFVKRQYKNKRAPAITPYQRHDLIRLIQLNDVFRKYHWYSEPIGKLFERVFEEIDRTISV
ncbi:MAG: hypothetical protein Q7T37_00055 [bacterium]|nr:hypothetical protein [bacterium]MDO8742713.1 hypothetical protein [bacterium]